MRVEEKVLFSCEKLRLVLIYKSSLPLVVPSAPRKAC
uniref:Uncharacterized protein n=1 Tax=Rhizophora mucronata TaxID=61149 RepID=A0A2P2Q5W9_RHIMU